MTSISAATGKRQKVSFDPKAFLSQPGAGKSLAKFRADHVVFSQGDAATSLFYILDGAVKVNVLSRAGKEAVIAILGEGDFFGEECLRAQTHRVATASTMTHCSIMRLEKRLMIRALHEQPKLSAFFMAYLLRRNLRIEDDLVHQLFNSSEKRLARILLQLSHFDSEDESKRILAPISQDTLAKMVGTTRSRVSTFMNKFRRLGFIAYNGTIEVRSALLNILLHD